MPMGCRYVMALGVMLAARGALAAGPAFAELTAAEKLVVDPPAISVRVTGATLEELAGALTKATGAPVGLRFQAETGWSAGRYTLDVTGEPFWNVMLQLNKEMYLRVSSEKEFILQNGRMMSRGVTVGGFFIFPVGMRRERIAVPPAMNPAVRQVQTLSLETGMVADPRIWVVMMQTPRVLRMVDERGRELLPQAQGENETGLARTRIASGVCSIQGDENVGRKIALLQGDAWAQVVMEEARLEVADVTGADKPVAAGGYLLKFETSDGGNGYVAVDVGATREPGTPEAPGAWLRLEDRGGVIWEGLIDEVGVRHFLVRDGKGPVRAVIRNPVRTKRVRIPFELKDLEIPL